MGWGGCDWIVLAGATTSVPWHWQVLILTIASLPQLFCLPEECNFYWFSPNSISVCSKYMSHIREVYFLGQVVRTNLTKSPSQNHGSAEGDICLFPYYSTLLISSPSFPPVHMYNPQLSPPPLMYYHKVDAFYIYKLTTSMSNSQQLCTPHSCAHLSHIGQVSDRLGHICVTLWHPLLWLFSIGKCFRNVWRKSAEMEAAVSGGRGGGSKVRRQRIWISVTLFRRPPQYILCLYL
jgi:hypothetical protein